MFRRTTTMLLCGAPALAACGSDSADDSTPATSNGGGVTTSAPGDTTTTAAVEMLRLVVTNDDGIGAPGIDVLVTALLELEAVEVLVVAPLENQSGSSDNTTPGGASHAAGATASGVEGTAVSGYPADSVVVALEELALDPHLVVSGVNEGQNTGPLAYLSGTVGAGREAVRRGVPAVAGSAGLGEGADYAAAAALVVEWIEANRAALLAGELPVEAVVSINVPDCTAGTMRPLLEVERATVIPEGLNPFASDCTIEPDQAPTDDLVAVAAGHATLTLIPPEAPPEG
ncbi:MAG: 5'/3'-nucleotidase SurE [Acidimicrobiales bacterium]